MEVTDVFCCSIRHVLNFMYHAYGSQNQNDQGTSPCEFALYEIYLTLKKRDKDNLTVVDSKLWEEHTSREFIEQTLINTMKKSRGKYRDIWFDWLSVVEEVSMLVEEKVFKGGIV